MAPTSYKLERVQSGRRGEDKRTVEVTKEKSIKVTVKVLVPVREHPKFNFVGKLLGPKGNSLKRLQEETMTKMAILGRGSFRDKAKEEELRKNPDPKYSHLHEDLHVEVTAHAPPAEAYARIAYALTEIRRYLVPDHNDEIRQEQMREMQLLNVRSGGGGGGGGGEGGDNHTDSSGSLSPPSSLSPPPPGPVKIPQTHTTQATVTTHGPIAHGLLSHPALRGLSRTQLGVITTGESPSAMMLMPHALPTVPGLAAAPAVPPTMIGRFPLMPLGSMATLGPHHPTRSMQLYEEYTDFPPIHQEYDPNTVATLQAAESNKGPYSSLYGVRISSMDCFPSLISSEQADGSDKKDGALKLTGNAVSRGRFRHEPYRRLAVNVPS
ncbi:uncharacterized protein LOC143021151 [Oratosquilla oratoria]|uniref:uncharacterized protein LOC143021151 n=1 Tax=Oratosquilla oratoria TaxID=337810 RepID=UPI003F76DB0C